MRIDKQIIVLAITAFLVGTEPAYAYLDPGMGSLLVQGILASLAGVAGVAWTFWYKIKSIFQRYGAPIQSKHTVKRPVDDLDVSNRDVSNR